MIKKNADALVIGAGLSGMMAAAAAAGCGGKVALAARGMGVVGLSSGCIDVWGYSPGNPDLVCRRPLEEVAALVGANPEHPYSRASDVLEESLEFFKGICSGSGMTYLDNRGGNWLVPTSLGTVRPTFLAPASMAVNSLEQAERVVVVGFQELKDFYPDVLAANLRANAGLASNCPVQAVTVSAGGGDLTTNTLARRLDQPGVLKEVAGLLKRLIQPGSLVLMPPVLGERPDSRLHISLREDLNCLVYEVAGLPPSLPGQRLAKALLKHLGSRGVEVITGCTVKGAMVSGGRCRWVTAVGGGGRTMQIWADAFVLATGSFLGGGLEAAPETVRETVFDLPVKIPSGEWAASDFLSMEGHSFSRTGIEVNHNLQPVDHDGRVLVENLLVAGANLSGCNYPIEKCGNGVALATGYKAGRLAGRWAGGRK